MATLQSNVHVGGEWYGPSYPDAGDPPSDVEINPAAYAPADVYDQHLGFREEDFAARGEPTGIEAREDLEPAALTEAHPRASRREADESRSARPPRK